MSRSTFGSHAYWRVQCYHHGPIALSAVLFKDNTGSTITPSGGTALESGHQSTFSSSNLFDGNDSTFWESQTTSTRNNWAGYHFTSNQTVMQMAVQKTASMDGSSPPSLVGFEFSDDGVVWGFAAWMSLGTAGAGLTNDTPKWCDFSQCLNP